MTADDEDDYGIWMTTESIHGPRPRWRRVLRWWRSEITYALYWRWTSFCHVHDRSHLPWRHRHCCARQYEHPAVKRIAEFLATEPPKEGEQP